MSLRSIVHPPSEITNRIAYVQCADALLCAALGAQQVLTEINVASGTPLMLSVVSRRASSTRSTGPCKKSVVALRVGSNVSASSEDARRWAPHPKPPVASEKSSESVTIV